MNPSRQQALNALASMQALPVNERRAMMTTKHAINTRVLSRNMLAYLEGAVLSEDGVPNFTTQELIDSLANALLQLGRNQRLGTAVLQTLVIELQDRINSQLAGK